MLQRYKPSVELVEDPPATPEYVRVDKPRLPDPRSFKFNYRTTFMSEEEAAVLDIPDFLRRSK